MVSIISAIATQFFGFIFEESIGTSKEILSIVHFKWFISGICSNNLSKLKFQKELKAVFIEQKINNVEIPQDKRLYVFEEFDCMMDIVAQRTHEFKNKYKQINSKFSGENIEI